MCILSYINMNQPWVRMCSPIQNPALTFLPPPSFGLFQNTSSECPASCIQLALVISFMYGNIKKKTTGQIIISYSLEDLPDPGIKPSSPALAGSFFTTSATWKTPLKYRIHIQKYRYHSFVSHFFCSTVCLWHSNF